MTSRPNIRPGSRTLWKLETANAIIRRVNRQWSLEPTTAGGIQFNGSEVVFDFTPGAVSSWPAPLPELTEADLPLPVNAPAASALVERINGLGNVRFQNSPGGAVMGDILAVFSRAEGLATSRAPMLPTPKLLTFRNSQNANDLARAVYRTLTGRDGVTVEETDEGVVFKILPRWRVVVTIGAFTDLLSLTSSIPGLSVGASEWQVGAVDFTFSAQFTCNSPPGSSFLLFSIEFDRTLNAGNGTISWNFSDSASNAFVIDPDCFDNSSSGTSSPTGTVSGNAPPETLRISAEVGSFNTPQTASFSGTISANVS